MEFHDRGREASLGRIPCHDVEAPRVKARFKLCRAHLPAAF